MNPEMRKRFTPAVAGLTLAALSLSTMETASPSFAQAASASATLPGHPIARPPLASSDGPFQGANLPPALRGLPVFSYGTSIRAGDLPDGALRTAFAPPTEARSLPNVIASSQVKLSAGRAYVKSARLTAWYPASVVTSYEPYSTGEGFITWSPNAGADTGWPVDSKGGRLGVTISGQRGRVYLIELNLRVWPHGEERDCHIAIYGPGSAEPTSVPCSEWRRYVRFVYVANKTGDAEFLVAVDHFDMWRFFWAKISDVVTR